MIKIEVNRQVGKKRTEMLVVGRIVHLEGSAECYVSLSRGDVLTVNDLFPFAVTDFIFAFKSNVDDDGRGGLKRVLFAYP